MPAAIWAKKVNRHNPQLIYLMFNIVTVEQVVASHEINDSGNHCHSIEVIKSYQFAFYRMRKEKNEQLCVSDAKLAQSTFCATIWRLINLIKFSRSTSD